MTSIESNVLQWRRYTLRERKREGEREREKEKERGRERGRVVINTHVRYCLSCCLYLISNSLVYPSRSLQLIKTKGSFIISITILLLFLSDSLLHPLPTFHSLLLSPVACDQWHRYQHHHHHHLHHQLKILFLKHINNNNVSITTILT